MAAIYGTLEFILEHLAEFAIMMFEYLGVCVIVISGIRGLINFMRRSHGTQLILEQGLSMGLGFLLGGEILRTVIVRDIQDILIVGGIVVLRVTLTILLHWEIKHEKTEHAEEKEN